MDNRFNEVHLVEGSDRKDGIDNDARDYEDKAGEKTTDEDSRVELVAKVNRTIERTEVTPENAENEGLENENGRLAASSVENPTEGSVETREKQNKLEEDLKKVDELLEVLEGVDNAVEEDVRR